MVTNSRETITIVIPARGGSKRIPGKNKRLFNGRPMVQWPVLSSCEVPGITRVVVSTDDKEIAAISAEAGASEVLKRPADLASDTAATAPVIRHAIDHLGLASEETVVCLYPTAAIPPSLIRGALELASAWPELFVVSVGRHASPLERALQLSEDGKMSAISHEFLGSRTQDLAVRYYDAGKLYVASASVWKSSETMMSSPFIPFFVPRWASVDIDDPEDWEIAEALHRVFALGGGK